jgi:threonine/homoserine/homoserine lactone efflux protein
MAFDLWLAFTLACVVLTLIPGPSVLLVISQSITKGRNAALVCIVGDMVGGIALMGLSFLGVGAILATSAILFQIVKWAGVFYLAYLGVAQILEAKRAPELLSDQQDLASVWRSFWAGTVTAILNPKAIIFYMAFLAQFIDPNADIGVQVVILTATSTMVVAVLLTGYAVIAARASQTFQSTVARKRIGYTGGSFMIGGSAIMAATR